MVELLLARGANKEHRNVSDYTPLSLAASGGYVSIIKILLNAGAEINSRYVLHFLVQISDILKLDIKLRLKGTCQQPWAAYYTDGRPQYRKREKCWLGGSSLDCSPPGSD